MGLLDTTLESIYRQKGNYEVIVIDDGGDKSTEMLLKKYPKMQYHYYANYGYLTDGSSKAYNMAAELSKGEIIIQQNAECYHQSETVVKDLAKACKSKHPVFATVINREGNPRVITDKEIKQKSGMEVSNTVQYSGISRKVPWFFCGAIMRKDWNDLGGYAIKANQVDVEFGERMIANGYSFDWLPKTIVIHQTHPKG